MLPPPSKYVSNLLRRIDILIVLQPTLLNLYDTYYLPLQAGLRPVTKSFILALLPGLEEETGEFFEKVPLFIIPNLQRLTIVSGSQSPGSPGRNGVALVLLPEYLAGDADYALCSGNFPQSSITSITLSERKGGYVLDIQ